MAFVDVATQDWIRDAISVDYETRGLTADEEAQLGKEISVAYPSASGAEIRAVLPNNIMRRVVFAVSGHMEVNAGTVQTTEFLDWIDPTDNAGPPDMLVADSVFSVAPPVFLDGGTWMPGRYQHQDAHRSSKGRVTAEWVYMGPWYRISTGTQVP